MPWPAAKQAEPQPKRALVLELAELEAIDVAMSDMQIESWGGCKGLPGFLNARLKIKEAIAACRASN